MNGSQSASLLTTASSSQWLIANRSVSPLVLARLVASRSYSFSFLLSSIPHSTLPPVDDRKWSRISDGFHLLLSNLNFDANSSCCFLFGSAWPGANQARRKETSRKLGENTLTVGSPNLIRPFHSHSHRKPSSLHQRTSQAEPRLDGLPTGKGPVSSHHRRECGLFVNHNQARHRRPIKRRRRPPLTEPPLQPLARACSAHWPRPRGDNHIS